MIVIETSMGTIKAELWADKSPKTVENFLQYVDDSFFDEMIFHRVIDGFMVQGGGFDQNMVQAVKGVGQKVLDKFEERQLLQTQTMPETGNTVVLLNMETTKTVYDELVTEAGITVFLHSTVISAQTDGWIITSIEAAHRGGRVTIAGRAFVDSSGDVTSAPSCSVVW